MKRPMPLLIVSLGVAVIALLLFLFRSRPPYIPVKKIQEVRLEMRHLPSYSGPVDVVSNDPKRIARLAALIASATPTEEHRCITYGQLTFTGQGIEPIKIGILPGHHPEFYELRANGSIFRMPRKPFIDQLTAFGYPQERFEMPQ